MIVTGTSRVLDAGASAKEAMELSRHSDPRLTMKTCARVLDNCPPTTEHRVQKWRRRRALTAAAPLN